MIANDGIESSVGGIANSNCFKTLSDLLGRLDGVLGPWEYHGCHEVEEMIANGGLEKV